MVKGLTLTGSEKPIELEGGMNVFVMNFSEDTDLLVSTSKNVAMGKDGVYRIAPHTGLMLQDACYMSIVDGVSNYRGTLFALGNGYAQFVPTNSLNFSYIGGGGDGGSPTPVIENPLNIKGIVNSVDDLPATATVGDLYFVGDPTIENLEEYVYIGHRFELLGTVSADENIIGLLGKLSDTMGYFNTNPLSPIGMTYGNHLEYEVTKTFDGDLNYHSLYNDGVDTINLYSWSDDEEISHRTTKQVVEPVFEITSDVHCDKDVYFLIKYRCSVSTTDKISLSLSYNEMSDSGYISIRSLDVDLDIDTSNPDVEKFKVVKLPDNALSINKGMYAIATVPTDTSIDIVITCNLLIDYENSGIAPDDSYEFINPTWSVSDSLDSTIKWVLDDVEPRLKNYTIEAIDELRDMYVPNSRTINDKSLDEDIVLTADDVNAVEVPSNLMCYPQFEYRDFTNSTTLGLFLSYDKDNEEFIFNGVGKSGTVVIPLIDFGSSTFSAVMPSDIATRFDYSEDSWYTLTITSECNFNFKVTNIYINVDNPEKVTQVYNITPDEPFVLNFRLMSNSRFDVTPVVDEVYTDDRVKFCINEGLDALPYESIRLSIHNIYDRIDRLEKYATTNVFDKAIHEGIYANVSGKVVGIGAKPEEYKVYGKTYYLDNETNKIVDEVPSIDRPLEIFTSGSSSFKNYMSTELDIVVTNPIDDNIVHLPVKYKSVDNFYLTFKIGNDEGTEALSSYRFYASNGTDVYPTPLGNYSGIKKGTITQNLATKNYPVYEGYPYLAIAFSAASSSTYPTGVARIYDFCIRKRLISPATSRQDIMGYTKPYEDCLFMAGASGSALYEDFKSGSYSMLMFKTYLLDDEYIDMAEGKKLVKWGKYVVTGEESDIDITTTDLIIAGDSMPYLDKGKYKHICNYAPCLTGDSTDYETYILAGGNFGGRSILWKNFVTKMGISSADEARAWLKQKYAEGNALTIYYELEEPYFEDALYMSYPGLAVLRPNHSISMSCSYFTGMTNYCKHVIKTFTKPYTKSEVDNLIEEAKSSVLTEISNLRAYVDSVVAPKREYWLNNGDSIVVPLTDDELESSAIAFAYTGYALTSTPYPAISTIYVRIQGMTTGNVAVYSVGGSINDSFTAVFSRTEKKLAITLKNNNYRVRLSF